ncbi:hypothetical protein [Burkholderia ubonensis]|uniref:hypothetical protein n=1 Tax=Burkholderia ubonensis TaxID=101571 RepID=UPI000A5E4B2B|nr:hypothetical protein [Burkholderia ubonensis]
MEKRIKFASRLQFPDSENLCGFLHCAGSWAETGAFHDDISYNYEIDGLNDSFARMSRDGCRRT